MTAITRAAAVPGRPDLIRRRVVGTPTEVAAAVALLAHTGRLVSATTPRQFDARDPSVTVIVTARLRPAVAVSASTRHRWIKPTVIGSASVTAVAAVGYGLAALARTVVHQTAAHWPTVVGALVLVALVLFALARKARCTGLHCPGCRTH
ncbi:hypothetical protein EV385_4397 [Krasilnikovia cinnamomea]|uniref:Uncharacterized protein n=1 Tax=Krasilnikovia cinnamomea TaxID=349313 RepID=A0A4Q7ZP92_9ACTN|nr:hypothetical protein [Krasilnikovia cinnamomea]RZU52531.1 hypothetical protein EV385_4397 [Krasilnikovia cinnamomea]